MEGFLLGENMNTSENINEIMGALSKAQGKIQPALKDKKNPFFKSNYADLSSVWGACRDALTENGLAVVQAVKPSENGMSLVTTLGHSSGQWIRSEMPIMLQKQDPQALGSALTYYRRYSLAALVGVVSDEDDDGNRASHSEKVKPIPKPQHISSDQLANLEDLFALVPEYKTQTLKFLASSHGIKSLHELNADLFERVKTGVTKKIAELEAKEA